MKKLLLGISLILFGFMSLYFGVVTELNAIAFIGVGIAVIGLIFSLFGYAERSDKE